MTSNFKSLEFFGRIDLWCARKVFQCYHHLRHEPYTCVYTLHSVNWRDHCQSILLFLCNLRSHWRLSSTKLARIGFWFVSSKLMQLPCKDICEPSRYMLSWTTRQYHGKPETFPCSPSTHRFQCYQCLLFVESCLRYFWNKAWRQTE